MIDNTLICKTALVVVAALLPPLLIAMAMREMYNEYKRQDSYSS